MFVFFIVSFCCLAFVLYSRVGRLAIVIEDIDSRCFCLVLLCYDLCVYSYLCFVLLMYLLFRILVFVLYSRVGSLAIKTVINVGLTTATKQARLFITLTLFLL